jgi:oligopeptide/dipeptide ABC transporter ATP-binding protein
MSAAEPLLAVEQLRKLYPVGGHLLATLLPGRRRQVRAVDAVSFAVAAGETLGLVGESGCGKSTTGLAVMQLAGPIEGKVRFAGRDITDLPANQRRQLRRDMQMVLQNPYSSLNPRLRVGAIIDEPLSNFRVGTAAERKDQVAELLERVGLSARHGERFPHEFSGGQRQRIGIARALALRPRLLVLDEPVSALDVSVQAQILNLLLELKESFGLTYLFISHDLGVVRHVSDRIAVMYLGRIVEVAGADELYEDPKHPYTAALLSAVPKGHQGTARDRIILTGDVPSPANPPPGCPFHPRCPKARIVAGGDGVPERCRTEMPPLVELSRGHQAACWYPVTAGESLHAAAHA